MSKVTRFGDPLVQASIYHFETETKDKHEADKVVTGIADKTWATFSVNGLLTVHKHGI